MAGLKHYLNRFLYYFIIALILFYILFPLYWMLLSSFRSAGTVFTVNYLPTNLTPINYYFLPLNRDFIRGLQNSIIVAGTVLILTLAIGAIAAYALGRLKFRGRRLIRYAVLTMTAFPQIAIVGGLYILVVNPCAIINRNCAQFGLYNTLWSLIITYLLLTLPLTIWFLTTYFRSLPSELEDAAYVDGATPFQTFYTIFLPLSAPGLVVTGVLSFVVAWNEFLFALTFTLDSTSRTAPVAISFFGNQGQGRLTALAASVMVTIPIVILAVVFRRQLALGFSGLASPQPAARTWLQRQWAKLGLPSLSVPAQILLIVLGLSLLAYLSFAWRAISFPYPLDYGEGPLLDQSVRLARFANIYRADISQPPFTVTNYPPLFMMLQTPLVWLFGPAFWYGRLISWCSTLAAALFVGLILHTLTRDRLAALVGALTLLAIPYVTYWSVLNRVDSLALALSLGALFVLVRRPQQRRAVIWAALLLTAAVYTRQSYGLAAPLAAFVWLFVCHPKYRALVLAAIVGGLGLSLFVLLNRLTGGGFFFNVVTANANQFRFDLLEEYTGELWFFMPYLLAGSAIFLAGAGWFRVKAWHLVAPYLVGAALSGLTIGKVGSNVNYFLELAAAMSLATGALIAWQRPRPLLQRGFMLILAAQIFLLLPGMRYQLFTQAALDSPLAMRRLSQIVDQADGPVLADAHMGILPLAGRSLYLQPFEATQLARDGVWDQTPLLEAIARQEFSAIIMLKVFTPFGFLHEINWSPEMRAQIERHYRQEELINDTIAVYRPARRQ